MKYYTSIRPHAPIGEPVVTYIRVLWYVPGGTITSKLQRDNADLQELPRKAKLSCLIMRTKFNIYVFITNNDDVVEKRTKNRIPIRGLKYAHLQELKKSYTKG